MDNSLSLAEIDTLLVGIELDDDSEGAEGASIAELDIRLDQLALLAERWHFYRQRGETLPALRAEMAQLACWCTLVTPFSQLVDDE